jgi:hypothetical protein
MIRATHPNGYSEILTSSGFVFEPEIEFVKDEITTFEISQAKDFCEKMNTGFVFYTYFSSNSKQYE